MARVRLGGRAIAPEALAAHDRHRPRVILGVLAVLLVYAWCFTQAAADLGLPTPRDLVDLLGLDGAHVLDDDGNVEAKLRVSHTTRMESDDERLLLFAGLFGCFLSVYFAPLRRKAWVMVGWFVGLFALFYGASATGALVAAHLTIYLAFHPTGRRSVEVAALWGGLVAALLGARGASLGAVDERLVALVGAAVIASALAYRALRPALARGGRVVRLVRGALAQTCMIVVVVAILAEARSGAAWRLPVGILYFCTQWARVLVYRVDYEDGAVPRDLPLGEYLAVFLSPAAIANFTYAPYLGQGYAYLRERHLAEDKSALVRSGVRLWWLALVYLIFAEQVTAAFIAAVDRVFGVKVYAFTSQLVRADLRGAELSTATVLLSTFVDQARIYLIYGGVTHFRVGVWRVLGYRVDPQYDRPWLATNLAALWGRFAFHLREFLVRVFYYPVFLRVLRRRPALRIFAATMAATVVGNLVWGHVPPATLGDLRWATLARILSTWPYFVLLGLGISITQVVLIRRRRTRRPWTRDRRLILDVACAYLTFQFFALIHVFIRPQEGGSLASTTRLFLKGLGIEL
ncbi:MAG: hypothetical protein R3B09_26010 [Nannocystaceae bacterium]